MSREVGNNCAGLPPAVVVWESCECFVITVACVRPWAGCSVPERSSAFVATVLTEWPASVSWCKSTKGVVYKDQNIPLKEWVSEIVITALSLTLCPHNWLKGDVYTAMKWALEWWFSMTQATHIIKSVYVWASLSLLTGDLSLRLAPNVSVSKGRVAVIDYWVIAADRVRVCDGLVMCEELNANVFRTGLFSPRPSLLYPFNMSLCVYWATPHTVLQLNVVFLWRERPSACFCAAHCTLPCIVCVLTPLRACLSPSLLSYYSLTCIQCRAECICGSVLADTCWHTPKESSRSSPLAVCGGQTPPPHPPHTQGQIFACTLLFPCFNRVSVR